METASLPVAYRLYLPESWASDAKRRKKAGVPETIEFQTKPKIALQQIEWACAAGLPRGVVEMDCAYGSDLSLRRRLTALDLVYAVGVWARTLVRETDKKGDAEPVKTCPSPRLPTQRLSRSGLSATWRTRSQRSAVASTLASSLCCRAALAVRGRCAQALDAGIHDAV